MSKSKPSLPSDFPVSASFSPRNGDPGACRHKAACGNRCCCNSRYMHVYYICKEPECQQCHRDQYEAAK